MSAIISMNVAHRIWCAHREIEAGEKLIAEMEAAIRNGEPPTPLNAFGRRKQVEMGVPSGDNSSRIFQVAPTLAIAVIKAHIAEKRAELVVVSQEAAAELGL